MNNENKDLRIQVFSGLIWRFAERISTQVVQFVVSIILARLLMPEDYGIIALITVFISVAEIIVESGMGNALIQKQHADQTDFSSTFYFNVFLGMAAYLILFFFAPLIADFYKEPLFVPVIRVLALGLIIGGVNGVQQAYVSRHMQFKRFFFASGIGTLVSAVVGIAMAYGGFGVWALVAQNLTNRCIDTVVLWVTVKWRPSLKFSFVKMKNLYTFGWKLLISGLINTLYTNIFSLVIGKRFTSESLAYYNRGNSIPSMITTNIDSSIQSVLLPAFSSVQGDSERLKAMVRRSIKTSSFLMMPAMAGLAVVSEPLIQLLLTDKWLPSVPYMQLFCFIYAIWPIHTANLQAITAVGRSDIFLKLEIIKCLLGLGVLMITLPMGLESMMIGLCISEVLSAPINAWPNRKLLNYSFLEQIKDLLPTAALAIGMACMVHGIGYIVPDPLMQLVLQLFAGIMIYLAGAIIFKMESFEYLKEIVKKKMRS